MQSVMTSLSPSVLIATAAPPLPPGLSLTAAFHFFFFLARHQPPEKRHSISPPAWTSYLRLDEEGTHTAFPNSIVKFELKRQ
jgi:hypothetical protein